MCPGPLRLRLSISMDTSTEGSVGILGKSLVLALGTHFKSCLHTWEITNSSVQPAWQLWVCAQSSSSFFEMLFLFCASCASGTPIDPQDCCSVTVMMSWCLEPLLSLEMSAFD